MVLGGNVFYTKTHLNRCDIHQQCLFYMITILVQCGITLIHADSACETVYSGSKIFLHYAIL